MVLKSGSEAALLQASKQYDAALKEQNLEKLDSLVDPNYTIHADGITLKVPAWSACACKAPALSSRLALPDRPMHLLQQQAYAYATPPDVFTL